MHPIWDEPPEVWACDATTNTTMSMNMNPTPESLAALAGLINYDPDVDEGLKFRVLKGQVIMKSVLSDVLSDRLSAPLARDDPNLAKRRANENP